MIGLSATERRVLERIADRVADDRGGVQLGALRLELGLHDLLRVVPGAAGVGHEDGLVQAEQRDGDQVADEEVRLDEGEGQRGEEDDEEDVEHALLRVLGADLHDLLAVGHRGLRGALELDVRLDELHRPVGAGGHGLGRGAGEPVDHRAAGDEAEQERRVQDREVRRAARAGAPAVSARMIEKIIVVAPTTAVPMSTGLAVALKVLPAAVVLLEVLLGQLEVGREAEVALDLGLDAGDLLDGRELVDRLGVVGHRAVGVHRDGDRAHAEEAERHEAEGEDRRRQHEAAQAERAHAVGDAHQARGSRGRSRRR